MTGDVCPEIQIVPRLCRLNFEELRFHVDKQLILTAKTVILKDHRKRYLVLTM